MIAVYLYARVDERIQYNEQLNAKGVSHVIISILSDQI